MLQTAAALAQIMLLYWCHLGSDYILHCHTLVGKREKIENLVKVVIAKVKHKLTPQYTFPANGPLWDRLLGPVSVGALRNSNVISQPIPFSHLVFSEFP